MNHVILLGDSIFDNDRYVPGGPSVIQHVQRNLPPLFHVDAKSNHHVMTIIRK